MMNTDKRGFSLVELMVVVGALGGMSLIALNLTKQMTKSSSKYQFESEVGLITTEMSKILSDPKKCLATFRSGGANISSPTNINAKYYIAGNDQAPASGYGNGGVSINDYAFTKSAYPSNAGLLNITFKNKNILKGTSGPATVSKKINLNIVQDSGGVILSCKSLSASLTDIWSHNTGTNIYYSDGFVGIGTISPLTKLDVAGTMKSNLFNVAGTITSAQLDISGSASVSQLTTTPGAIVSNGTIESKSGGIKFPDGSIQTKSLTNKYCPSGQYLSGISPTGSLVCSYAPIAAPGNCVGSFGACSPSCGFATKTYYITTPASSGGTACPYANGTPQSCGDLGPCFVNCVGTWSKCSKTCGGGTRTFTVTTYPAGSGTLCPIGPDICNTQSCVIGGGSCWNSASVMNTKLPKNNCSQSCGGPDSNSDGCPYTWNHWGVAQFGWICTRGTISIEYQNYLPNTAGGQFSCNQAP